VISKIHKIENVICENHYKSKHVTLDVKNVGAKLNVCKPYIALSVHRPSDITCSRTYSWKLVWMLYSSFISSNDSWKQTI